MATSQFIQWTMFPNLTFYQQTVKNVALGGYIRNPHKHALAFSFAPSSVQSFPSADIAFGGSNNAEVRWDGSSATNGDYSGYKFRCMDLQTGFIANSPSGNSKDSPFGSIFVRGQVVLLPSAPIGVAVAVLSASRLSLSWTRGEGGSDPVSYRVYEGPGAAGPWTGPTTDAASPYERSGLAVGTTKYFYLTAVDANAAVSGDSVSKGGTTAKCLPPPTIFICDKTDDLLEVEWEPPTTGTAAVSTKLYHATSPWGPFDELVGATSPHEHTGLDPSTDHWYYATAVDQDGFESDPSATVSARTNALAVAPPMPTGLTITRTADLEFEVAWTPGVGEPVATTYHIHRDTSQSGSFPKIAEDATSPYVDSDPTLAYGTTYWYRVRAFDSVSGLQSELTQAESGTTGAQLPGIPQGLTVQLEGTDDLRLNWSANSSGSVPTNYRIVRSTTGLAGSYGQLAFTGSAATTYLDQNLGPGTYYYRVSAIDAEAEESTRCEAKWATIVALTPSTPTSLGAQVQSQSTIKLDWTAGADGSTITQFWVHRSLSGLSGSFTKLPAGTVTAPTTTFSDGTCAPNTTYWYQVSAYDGSTESGKSNTVSAKTPSALVSGWPTQGATGLTAVRNRAGFAADTRHAFQGKNMGESVTIHRVDNFAEYKTAVESSGNRIVVFTTSGTYDGNGATITYDDDNLWVAGQTAPNPGVTIRNARHVIRNSNMLFQHMRWHLTEDWTDQPNADVLAIGGQGVSPHNLVWDHCNLGMTFDEIYDMTIRVGACDVDFIECMFLYPLHCPGLRTDEVSGGKDHAHGPRQSAQVDVNVRVSWQACMAGHNLGRLPRTSVKNLLIANNLFYNWQNVALEMYGEISMQQFGNIIGNICKKGPNSGSKAPFDHETSWGAGANSLVHYSGNWIGTNLPGDQFASTLHQTVVANGKRSATRIASALPTGYVDWSTATASDKAKLEQWVLSYCGARPMNRNPSSSGFVDSYQNNGAQIKLADAASKAGCTKGTSPGADPNLAQNAQTFTEVANPWSAHATETDRRNIEVQLLDASLDLIGAA